MELQWSQELGIMARYDEPLIVFCGRSAQRPRPVEVHEIIVFDFHEL